jgi:hypothetical protein
MKVTSADIAASVQATCQDIALSMQTYQRAPLGLKLRDNLIISAEALHERLGHLMACLARKHAEER